MLQSFTHSMVSCVACKATLSEDDYMLDRSVGPQLRWTSCEVHIEMEGGKTMSAFQHQHVLVPSSSHDGLSAT